MNSNTDQKPNSRISPRDIKLKKPNPEISCTCFTGAPGNRLTKRFYKDEQRQIRKESQPQFYDGEAETLTRNRLSDIESVIESLETNQCIATGIFDIPNCRITTKAKYNQDDQDSMLRTRSKDHMHQPECGLVLLDYDPDPYMPEHLKCNDSDVLMAKVTQAVPELDGIGYSAVGSSSNGIFNEKTNEPYEGSGGMHVYIAVLGVDLDELQQFLKVRLWNAGSGYISFARNGATLERTIIDLSVLSPERLIYEASPVLGEGVGQKPRVWTHVEGKVCTGDAVMLTDEEITQYKQRMANARKDAEAIRVSNELQNRYREKQIDMLVEKEKVSRDEAKQRIPKRSLSDLFSTRQTLALDETIEIAGQVMRVSELVARGKEFDEMAMPDPVEGSEYGATTAKFYFNHGNNPCIHSFAHGVKTVFEIDVPQRDMDAFERTTTEVVSAGPKGGAPRGDALTATDPIEPKSFPHPNPNASGYPVSPTIPNFKFLCKYYGIGIQWDVISKEIQVNIPGLTGISDNSNNTKIALLESLAIRNGMSRNQVSKYMAAIADSNPVNFVLTWIRIKPWDGIDRLKQFFDTVQAQDDYPDDFKNLLMYRWLLSVAAAATKSRGSRSKGMLVLQGRQSLGKTTWVSNLIPPGLIRDKAILLGHHLDPSAKDSVTTAIKHLIVEVGELDSSFKKDMGKLKSFITLDMDHIRRPYAASDSEYPRRTVFCATVNDTNFLLDATGNTRFWTIPVEHINYDHGIDMQQVFAQLDVELQRGAEWWLSHDEEIRLEKLNAPHRTINAIEERTIMVMNRDLPKDQWRRMKPIEVLMGIGYRNPSNRQCKDCADVLRREFGEPSKIQGYYKYHVPFDPRLVPES